MTTLKIHLLGEFELYGGNELLQPPATLKARSLLAYLIIHRDRAWAREALADLFWPDRLRDKALHNLSTALWHIRRVLPPGDYILADAQTVRFNLKSEYWLDVKEFESKVQEAGCKDRTDASCLPLLASCILLYRGDFLEGFYDDWCLEERYRLESLYLKALERLVTGYEALNQPEEALHYAGLLLARNPLREDVQRAATRLHVQLGNRAEALRQAQWCRAVLRTELGIEPAAETTALYDELLGPAWRREPGQEVLARRGSLPRSQPDLILERPPLVGRETEWKTLLGLWDRAQAGQGHLVLVSGEAGIGKSRLTEELSQYVRQRGSWVAGGRCYEYERALPRGPLADILRDLLAITDARFLGRLLPWQAAELVRLTPELRARFPSLPADRGEICTGQEQTRLFDAITFFLLNLVQQNPLLLVLEDLHWASDSTLTWLHYLTRRLADAPILLIATCRREGVGSDHPLHGLALQLEQEGLVMRLELGRLSRGDLALWMTGASDPLVMRIHRQTEGNPFFTLETLRALFEGGQVRLVGGRWVEGTVPASLPIPASVRQVVQMRLDRLSPPTRKAVAVAAVIGRVFDFAVLEQAWSRDEEATLWALDELLRRRLVREGSSISGSDYEFNHHLVREVIYRGLHYRRRRRLHRLAGEVLERLYASREDVAGELAYHFGQAGEHFRALPYLIQAGYNAAALYAYDEAEDYWKQAFSIFASLPQEEATRFRKAISEVLFNRAEFFHLQGRLEERQTDIFRLRNLAKEAGDDQLLNRVLIRETRYLNLDGRYEVALEQAQEATARCRQYGNTDGEAQSLAEWGFAHYFRGEYPEAMQRLERALQLEQSDPATRGAVLSVLSYTYYLIADYQRSLAYRRQALEIRSALGKQARMAEDLTDMGILYMHLHRQSLAGQYLEKALRLARAIGSQPAESYALNHLGDLYYLRGNYSTALEYYADSLVLQRATGSRRGEASALGNAGKPLLAMGDYKKAEASLRESLTIQEEIDYKSGLSEGLAQLALVLMHTGQDKKVLEAATRSLTIAQHIGNRYCQVTALNVLTRWHIAWNEPSKAITFAQEAIALAQEINLEDGRILGSALLGQAQLALGEPVTALEHAAQAVALLEKQGYFEGPEEEIYFTYYQALKAVGQHERAAAALQKAYAEVIRKAKHLSSEQRRQFLEKVPGNRQIIAAGKTSLFA